MTVHPRQRRLDDGARLPTTSRKVSDTSPRDAMRGRAEVRRLGTSIRRNWVHAGAILERDTIDRRAA